MSFEAVIVQRKDINERVKLDIKRYLFLHRYNFWLNPDKIDINDLGVKKRRRSVGDYKDIIVGIFRVWRYMPDGKILQSFICINEYYRAVCFNKFYNKEEYNKQVCIIHPSAIKGRRYNNEIIHITAHPKKRSGFLSSIVLQVKSNLLKKEYDILAGKITVADRDSDLPFQSIFIMQKTNYEPFLSSNGDLSNDTFNEIENEMGVFELKELTKYEELYQRFISLAERVNKS